MRALALAATLLAVPFIAGAAGPYDGSVPMKCMIKAIFDCVDAASCVRGTAQTVSLPPVFTLDVNKRPSVATPLAGPPESKASSAAPGSS